MTHKPKTTRKAEQAQPPLGDPRWVPNVEVWRWLQRRRGDPDLASRNLTEAICKGEVQVARCHIHTDNWEYAPTYLPGLCVADGEIVRRFDFERRREWVLYVWGPDVAKRWPEWKPSADDDDGDLVRHRPGPPPTKHWKMHVAAELSRIVIAGVPEPSADHFRTHCQTKTGYLPELRDVQKLLSNLRKLLG